MEGEPTHLFIRMYKHTHTARHGTCVFFDIKNHTHACSMHIRFSFRIMIKLEQWQSIVMQWGADMYVCEMIVVKARGGLGVYILPQENF